MKADPVAAGLLFGAVLAFCFAQLAALRMWLAFKEKSFVHLPLVQMQAEIEKMKSQLLASAMRR